MRAADIREARESNPRVPFAVKVPRYSYGRRDGTEVVKIDVARVDGHRVFLNAHPTKDHPVVVVQPAAVLTTWEQHSRNLRREAEAKKRRQEAERREADAMKAAQRAAVEAVLPAFEGIMIPAQGTANFDRPDEPLVDYLRSNFIEHGGCEATMFSRDAWVAVGQALIARRTIEVD